jgi:hypothetical protein
MQNYAEGGRGRRLFFSFFFLHLNKDCVHFASKRGWGEERFIELHVNIKLQQLIIV